MSFPNFRDFERRLSRKSLDDANDLDSTIAVSRRVLGALKPGRTGKVGNDRSKITCEFIIFQLTKLQNNDCRAVCFY